jgi:hypothetical protein
MPCYGEADYTLPLPHPSRARQMSAQTQWGQNRRARADGTKIFPWPGFIPQRCDGIVNLTQEETSKWVYKDPGFGHLVD